MTPLVIGFADVGDAEAAGALLADMDRWYHEAEAGSEGAPDRAPDGAHAEMVRRTIETREGTRFVLARARGAAVGIGCVAVLRPGNGRRGLVYVKDLFVPTARRGAGIGGALLRWIGAWASREGLGRVDLSTDRENRAAQRFYRRLGGIEPGRAVLFRFDPAALARSGA